MAKTSIAEEFDGAPSESDRLLAHNMVVRDNLKMILALKEAIEDGDLAQAAMYWFNTPTATQNALWIAPSKGGIFTTTERDTIKSKDFRIAHFGDA